jgi:hypothetical protein
MDRNGEGRITLVMKRQHGQKKRLCTAPQIQNGDTSRSFTNRRDQLFIFLAIICGIFSLDMTSALSTSFRRKSRFANSQIRSPNICILCDQQNQDQDETIQSAIPIQPLPPSQYVQQEQLLEIVSRIGAETIASLSISERTKRAMLAEAVEDEIFACTEQMIDLVNEQQENDVIDDSNQSELSSRQNTIIENKIRDLKERNHFLQGQYNDLVSGRSSSLLNTVNSIGDSTTIEDSYSSVEQNNTDGEIKFDSDDASYNQFN